MSDKLFRALLSVELAVLLGGSTAAWALPAAMADRGYWAIGGEWLLIIAAFIQGPWSGRLGIVLALANFFLFFGGGFLRQIRAQIGWWKTRRNFRRKNRDDIHYY